MEDADINTTEIVVVIPNEHASLDDHINQAMTLLQYNLQPGRRVNMRMEYLGIALTISSRPVGQGRHSIAVQLDNTMNQQSGHAEPYANFSYNRLTTNFFQSTMSAEELAVAGVRSNGLDILKFEEINKMFTILVELTNSFFEKHFMLEIVNNEAEEDNSSGPIANFVLNVPNYEDGVTELRSLKSMYFPISYRCTIVSRIVNFFDCWSTRAVTTEEDLTDTCVICLNNYTLAEDVRILSCTHKYHRKCIDEWLIHDRLCPICRGGCHFCNHDNCKYIRINRQATILNEFFQAATMPGSIESNDNDNSLIELRNDEEFGDVVSPVYNISEPMELMGEIPEDLEHLTDTDNDESEIISISPESSDTSSSDNFRECMSTPEDINAVPYEPIPDINISRQFQSIADTNISRQIPIPDDINSRQFQSIPNTDNNSRQYQSIVNCPDLHCRQFHSIPDMNSTQFQSIPDMDSRQFRSIPDMDSRQFRSIPDMNSIQFPSFPDMNYNRQFPSIPDMNSGQFQLIPDLNFRQFQSISDMNSRQFHSIVDMNPAQYQSISDVNSRQFQFISDMNSSQFHSIPDTGNSGPYQSIPDGNISRHFQSILDGNSLRQFQSISDGNSSTQFQPIPDSNNLSNLDSIYAYSETNYHSSSSRFQMQRHSRSARGRSVKRSSTNDALVLSNKHRRISNAYDVDDTMQYDHFEQHSSSSSYDTNRAMLSYQERPDFYNACVARYSVISSFADRRASNSMEQHVRVERAQNRTVRSTGDYLIWPASEDSSSENVATVVETQAPYLSSEDVFITNTSEVRPEDVVVDVDGSTSESGFMHNSEIYITHDVTNDVNTVIVEDCLCCTNVVPGNSNSADSSDNYY